MSGIQLKLSGSGVHFVPFTVRVTHGAFMTGPDNSLEYSDIIHSVTVAPDALSFALMVMSSTGSRVGDLNIVLLAAPGVAPVITVEQDMAEVAQLAASFHPPAPWDGSGGGLLGVGPPPPPPPPRPSWMPEDTYAAMHLLPQSTQYRDHMARLGIPVSPPPPPPQPVPDVITVSWVSAAGPQSRNVARHVPLTLDGYLG